MAAIAAPIIGGIVSAFTGGCGPSAEEKQQMGMQTSMEQDLMTAFNQRVGQQQETISSLNTALSNAAAGKFPPGMDPTTLASFTSKAMITTSRAYQQAAQAAQSALAGRGGGAAGAAGLLSGPEAQVIGDITAKGAAEESDLLMQVQYEDWQAGREDYTGYIKGLETMAELQDPTKLAGAMADLSKTSTQLSETMAQQKSQEAVDIGTAATNVAAGLGAMIQQQTPGQVISSTQQRTNRALAAATPGVVPGTIPTTGTLITPPGIAPVPTAAQSEYEVQ